MKNIFKVSDSKFKSIYISYNFTFKSDTKDYMANAVMSQVLSKSCNKYRTTKEMEEYLSNLYGTSFDVDIQKIGDLYSIEFKIECINKKFLPNNEDVFKDSLKFLYEIIYNPLVSNNKFSKEIFEREKLSVLDKINTRKDEKLKYGVAKTEELLCEDEGFGTFVYGEKEYEDIVTNEYIYNTYINMLNNSSILVILSGNLEGYENIESEVKSIFGDKLEKGLNFKEISKYINYNNNNYDYREIIERMPTMQSVIGIGMKIKDISKNDFYAISVYNAILGGTPSSKLFQNVREKESLAYTTRSRYYRFKNIFVLYAGIEENNYIKAKEVMINQINDMKKGNISTIELESAKESLINDLMEWNDSKITLSKLLFINTYEEIDVSISDMIKNIKLVTISDVINIASKIQVKLVYLLGGEESVG